MLEYLSVHLPYLHLARNAYVLYLVVRIFTLMHKRDNFDRFVSNSAISARLGSIYAVIHW